MDGRAARATSRALRCRERTLWPRHRPAQRRAEHPGGWAPLQRAYVSTGASFLDTRYDGPARGLDTIHGVVRSWIGSVGA